LTESNTVNCFPLLFYSRPQVKSIYIPQIPNHHIWHLSWSYRGSFARNLQRIHKPPN